MGKSIDEMDCFIGALLNNKQLNVSLIDLVWENSIDASVTFGTHTYNTVCVCVCDIHNMDLNVQSCSLLFIINNKQIINYHL